MSIANKLQAEIQEHSNRTSDFIKQLEAFELFKQKLGDAGLSYDDRYDIPLMNRIGQTFCNSRHNKHPFN